MRRALGRRIRRRGAATRPRPRRRPLRPLVGAAAYGPQLFRRDDVPETELRALHPGDELPGALLACHDGRGVLETPLYLPEQRALVLADALEREPWSVLARRLTYGGGQATASP